VVGAQGSLPDLVLKNPDQPMREINKKRSVLNRFLESGFTICEVKVILKSLKLEMLK
jgi:hypothetical protein